MIGASIYGFVDYKKTSHNKEFSNMYEEKTTPVVGDAGETTAPIVNKETGSMERQPELVVAPRKKAITKNRVAAKTEIITVVSPVAENKMTTAIHPVAADEIIAVQSITPEEKIAPEKIGPATVSMEVKTSKNSEVEKKVKKKKKFSSKAFSRAPLRDRE